ncbi:MAG: hypothetical protein ACTSXU_02250, partial [Promethearchaeota archaeon]
LKKCPECGTLYHWEYDYEFFVNGTEDYITLKRIPEREESEWLEKVAAIIKKKKKELRARALSNARVLTSSDNRDELIDATNFFYNMLMFDGHDISFLITKLITALGRHPHDEKEDYCFGEDLAIIIKSFSDKSKENKKKVLKVMARINPTTSGTEFNQLLSELKGTRKEQFS